MANKDIYFRADVVRSGDIRVNREQEVITGFAVVTKGVTHDERGEFDDLALNSVVELGNKSKMGIKSRFGHPNMSSTALGTFLGRAKNFRKDGDVVRADLHIDSTAHQTPDGDLAGYVMNLAESDPEACGSSMVIHWDALERKELSADGKALPPLIRVKKLMSVDVVDDPAANNGLFGTQVEYAVAGDPFIGITAARAVAGEMVSVDLKNTGRTFKMVANGAIAVGGNFYGAIDGKISATVSGSIQGRVLEAPANDGEIVECILL